MIKTNDYYRFDRKGISSSELVLGIDEVGRGCWAGPLVACGIILESDFFDSKIRDSKLTSFAEREVLYSRIVEHARYLTVLKHSPLQVDHWGPKQSSIKLMTRIANQLGMNASKIFIDYETLKDSKYSFTSILKGDRTSYAIAAASIVAKVIRDRMMVKLDLKYPQFGFRNHKGYGTKEHLTNLQKYGPILKIHRFSYHPIKVLLENF